MKAQFKFLSGARAGLVETVRKAYIGLGRHPLSDVRFDSERDLDVSARHAAIVHKPEGFFLQDLGSKNGTFVNGHQVSRETLLADGDVIGFGPKGPAVEFRVQAEHESELVATAEDAVGRTSRAREPMPAVTVPEPARPRRSSTAVRVALEVARQTRQLRTLTKVLLGVLFATVVGFGTLQVSAVRQRRLELRAMQARADSLLAETQRTRTEVQGLTEALQQSREEIERLHTQIRTGGDAATLALLREQLSAAEQRSRGLIGAAGVDYRAISRANQDAVVLVLVEYAPGEAVSGTGFAIDSQGTIVTNKHVLVGEDGSRRPLRIGVMFAGSQQFFPAALVATAPDLDVGVVRAPIRGGNPVVTDLVRDRQAVERGDPVAILGYPLGLDLPMDRVGRQPVADPTLTVGTVSKVLAGLVQVDGYGAPGSSGSPLFDRNGRVIGLLFGGVKESAGRIVYAVPSHLVAEFLDTQGLIRR